MNLLRVKKSDLRPWTESYDFEISNCRDIGLVKNYEDHDLHKNMIEEQTSLKTW